MSITRASKAAEAVAVILPLSVLSAFIYARGSQFDKAPCEGGVNPSCTVRGKSRNVTDP